MKISEFTVKGKTEQYIPVGFAFSYAIQRELEAILGISISDDEFQEFIDDKLSDIDENLEGSWNSWKEEKEQEEKEDNY